MAEGLLSASDSLRVSAGHGAPSLFTVLSTRYSLTLSPQVKKALQSGS